MDDDAETLARAVGEALGVLVDYLQPDSGVAPQDAISGVLGALDNPGVNQALRRVERVPEGALPIRTLRPRAGVAVYDEMNEDWITLDERQAAEIASMPADRRWNWDGAILTGWKLAGPKQDIQ